MTQQILRQRAQLAHELSAQVGAITSEQKPRSQSLFTVAQFAEEEPAFTEAALRNLIFKAEVRHSSAGIIAGNGMIESGALVRIGRKVLIDRAKFLAWVQQ